MRLGGQTRTRVDEHDLAVRSGRRGGRLAQGGQQQARQFGHREQVQLERPPPGLGRDLRNRPQFRDAGAVHEDVEPFERGLPEIDDAALDEARSTKLIRQTKEDLPDARTDVAEEQL